MYKNCIECPNHLIVNDPDPTDSFVVMTLRFFVNWQKMMKTVSVGVMVHSFLINQ